MTPHDSKVRNGQFYTVGNPFILEPFARFYQSIPEGSGALLEPFAGANNIVRLMIEAGFDGDDWTCYDLHPEAQSENTTPQFPVEQRDTILDYPAGFSVAVTNPPYLAKNSATRKKMNVDFGPYADLYQVSLAAMLERTEYVAAIIPESFITSKFSKDRCTTIISLTAKMFEDTDHPVCLALFTPEASERTELYRDNHYLGDLDEVKASTEKFFSGSAGFKPRFNVPTGALGFRGIDGTRGRSIEFFDGEQIPSTSIKVSSRSLSRIDLGVPCDQEALIIEANRLIEEYRDLTDDVLLTSFKGIRKDGLYRRRMDFATAGRILGQAYLNLG